MPDAWNTLLANSTADPTSDAWTHLISQEGGGGTIFVGGDLTANMAVTPRYADIELAMESNVSTVLSVNLRGIMTTVTNDLHLEAQT